MEKHTAAFSLTRKSAAIRAAFSKCCQVFCVFFIKILCQNFFFYLFISILKLPLLPSSIFGHQAVTPLHSFIFGHQVATPPLSSRFDHQAAPLLHSSKFGHQVALPLHNSGFGHQTAPLLHSSKFSTWQHHHHCTTTTAQPPTTTGLCNVG